MEGGREGEGRKDVFLFSRCEIPNYNKFNDKLLCYTKKITFMMQ